MTTEPNQDIEWTGERYVPQLRGTIALEHLHRYAYASEYVKDKVILDIASGEGYGSDMLSRTAKHVYGVDVDAVSVAHARAKYSSEKLNFWEGSCTEIPLEDQSVDVVVSFETIEHITDHEKMMSEVKRVLRPGGILIISSPEKHEYSEVPQHHNPFHLKELDQEEFLGLLNKHFKYSAFLGQRVIYGSALVEMEKPSATAKTYQVDDLPQQIEAASGLPRPIYLIGVCSDHPIQAASGGVCEQNIHQSEPIHAYQKIIIEKESVIAEKDGVIAEKEGVIAEKEGVIAEKEGVIAEKEGVIAEKEKIITDLENQLLEKKEAFTGLYSEFIRLRKSKRWKVTRPLRFLGHTIRSGLKSLNRIRTTARILWIHGRSGIFDPVWYLENNPDVRDSRMNPWWHFAMYGIYEERPPNKNFTSDDYIILNKDVANYKYGYLHYIWRRWNERRKISKIEGYTYEYEDQKLNPLGLQGYKKRNSVHDIVYISGFPNSPSHSYRVVDAIEAFREIDIDCTWIKCSEINIYKHELHFCKCIYLFRVTYTEELEGLIASWKEAGVVICYDCDDYIFDTEVANTKNVDGLRYFSEEQIRQYNGDINKYKKALMLCDLATFSTSTLVSAGNNFGIKSILLHNTVNDYKLKLSTGLKQSKSAGGIVTIGYASGSYTHQKDLKVALCSIIEILRKYHRVSFCIVGDILINEFEEYKTAEKNVRERIIVKKRVKENQLLNEINRFDINIAPLEIDNPYCEAKSELKYFDAGILAIPTVASGTNPFKAAIKNGKNGFIANNNNEWMYYLEKLIKNKDERIRIGKNAYEHVSKHYIKENKKSELNNVLSEIEKLSKSRVKASKKTLTIVLPGLILGSGGHAIHFDIAKQFARKGMIIRLVFMEPTSDFKNTEEIEKYADLNTKNIKCSFDTSLRGITNIIFATHWSTVSKVIKTCNSFKKYYIILDYEPFFYAMCEDYIKAQYTYKHKLSKITWGPWIKQILEKYDNVTDVVTFPFYYSKKTYYINRLIKRDLNKVLFFARPSMPRRCFHLGIESISKFQKKYGYSTEFILFGATGLSNLNLPIKFTDMGVLSPIQLQNLYNKSALGIVFSTTNPSKAPFEMMACGLPVLDLNINSSELSYGSSENSILCDPDSDVISDKIYEILSDNKKLKLISNKALKYSETIVDEETASNELYKIINL